MGQSLTSIYVHAVFGTKFRQPFIDQSIEKKLHAYMAGILNNLNNSTIIINSMPDHIHILFRMSKNHSISQIMELIKKESSKWMKKQGSKNFKWQIGYGAFSVSQSKVEIVKNYIANQKKHHNKMSYVTEVEKFMKEYKVDQFSKEYYWD